MSPACLRDSGHGWGGLGMLAKEALAGALRALPGVSVWATFRLASPPRPRLQPPVRSEKQVWLGVVIGILVASSRGGSVRDHELHHPHGVGHLQGTAEMAQV